MHADRQGLSPSALTAGQKVTWMSLQPPDLFSGEKHLKNHLNSEILKGVN